MPKPIMEPTAAIVRWVTDHPGSTSDQIADGLFDVAFPYVLKPSISRIGVLYKLGALSANGFLVEKNCPDRKRRYFAPSAS